MINEVSSFHHYSYPYKFCSKRFIWGVESKFITGNKRKTCRCKKCFIAGDKVFQMLKTKCFMHSKQSVSMGKNKVFSLKKQNVSGA